jgi:tryptophan halogenase
MTELLNTNLKNKTIVVMGGGTSGYISALYFLHQSKKHNLNLKVHLVFDNEIGVIGVGEGTTPSFTNLIENDFKITREEFLKETKGGFKYGIKFNNWNFDGESYYHLFNSHNAYDSNINYLKYDFCQHAINSDCGYTQSQLQKKIYGESFDLIEENKVSLNINPLYAYHFSSDLLSIFLKRKCSEFTQFSSTEGNIKKVSYTESGFIEKIIVDDRTITGDFFINCLGFNSSNILKEDYFDTVYWDDHILNNSAIAIQVKNEESEKIDSYTTSSAEDYGWSWKIPQYEKTGYGYVYSDAFATDQEKLISDLIKTYNINEKNIFKVRNIKSKPYYNNKQLHKNCLSLGLSSGFIEPLEATSIHMTISNLHNFFNLLSTKLVNEDEYEKSFNDQIRKDWENVLNFVVFHYFTNNPINEYWKYYKNLESNTFYSERKYLEEENQTIFTKNNYFKVSLGMNLKRFDFTRSQEKYLNENLRHFFRINSQLDIEEFPSHNEILKEINQYSKSKKIHTYY